MIYAPRARAGFQPWFADVLRRATSDTVRAVGTNLDALVLGGGFGRGEGAVTAVTGRELPYNDVDLFLFVNEPAAVDASSLREIEERYTEELGAHFEFSRPIAGEELRSVRPALMWFDLIHGHEVLAGSAAFVDRFSAEVRGAIPPHEGTRLLLNRGAGLLMAVRAQLGIEAGTDPDFVRRNVWKARLALAESALIVAGVYELRADRKRALYREWAERARPRAKFLQPEEAEHAFEYKCDPDRFPGEPNTRQSAQDWVEAFLELESLRSGYPLASASAYQAWPANREPAANARMRLRNAYRSLRAGHLSTRHPRESLYRALGVVLLHPSHGDAERFLQDWRRNA